jgi:hypothetical protein
LGVFAEGKITPRQIEEEIAGAKTTVQRNTGDIEITVGVQREGMLGNTHSDEDVNPRKAEILEYMKKEFEVV